jgi:hypothetical protein
MDEPIYRAWSPALGKLDHVHGRGVAALATRPAFQSRFKSAYPLAGGSR